MLEPKAHEVRRMCPTHKAARSSNSDPVRFIWIGKLYEWMKKSQKEER